MKKEESPWYTSRDCYWPFNPEDTKVCDFDGGRGAHKCPHVDPVPISLHTWCGSNYDSFGNERFNGGYTDVLTGQVFDQTSVAGIARIKSNSTKFLSKEEYIALPSYNEDVNWGMTTFDTFGMAFVTVFQSITMEGWTPIMYMCQDAVGYPLACIFFGLLIVIGSFFVLSLLVAVLEENYSETKEAEQDENGVDDDGTAANASESKVEEEMGKKQVGHPTLRKWADYPHFGTFITFLIVINTVVLGSESYPMNPAVSDALEGINFFLTLMFAVEMAVKLGGYGLKEYSDDPMNLFDAFIVIMSLVELVVAPPAFLTGGNTGPAAVDLGGISALRGFRLFRVFKLAREWKSMRILLEKIILTVFDISNFALLLFLFMYIYSLMGMQFFANTFKFDDDGYAIPIGQDAPDGTLWAEIPSERHNFDDFHFAFVTIFLILSGENWNGVMYDGWRAKGPGAVIYFISLIVLGMFIVMTLFLAILLNNFGTEEEEKEVGLLESTEDMTDMEKQIHEEVVRASKRQNTGVVLPVVEADVEENAAQDRRFSLNLGSVAGPDDNIKSAATKAHPKVRKSVSELVTSVFPLKGNSLFVFGPQNGARNAAAKVVSHPQFDNTILVLIMVSSLMLAVDDPLADPESSFVKVLTNIDYFFTLCFVIEMSLKIVTMGFLLQKRSYLRDSWNVLDFLVVLISLITTFSSGDSSLSSLKSLRAFRAFRPLRMINRAPGLKLIVNCMFSSIPDVLNVSAVCALFFLIFSIFGVSMFKGQLRECQGEHFDEFISGTPAEAYLTNPTSWAGADNATKEIFRRSSGYFAGGENNVGECDFPNEPCCVKDAGGDLEHPEDWYQLDAVWFTSENPKSRQICSCLGATWDVVGEGYQLFDNVGLSFLGLFEISTTEGWADLMYISQDSTGIGMQPIRDSNQYMSFFFMMFILVGGYLVMNLFVGVIIDHFNEMRKAAEGDISYLTEEQQAWVKTKQIAARMKPKKKIFKPGNAFGDWCHDIVLRKSFESFIMSCICLNTIVMMLPDIRDSSAKLDMLQNANLAFAILFTIEMVMKISAMKSLYFADNWNRFDFVIVMDTLFGFVMKAAGGGSTSGVTTVIRTFRIGRIFRLVNGAESLNQLFNTLVLTIPGLTNIASLLGLLYFIFAVMAVQLFATVGFRGDYNVDANFRSFGSAFMTLLRFTTGENWNGFMHDVARGPEVSLDNQTYSKDICGYVSESEYPQCNSWLPKAVGEEINGPGNPLIYVVLISFNFVVCFVFMNLFIGIIIEGFDTADETKRSIKPDDFEAFSDHWSNYDPEGTFYITMDVLQDFVQTLYEPWGFGDYVATPGEIRAKIAELDLKVNHEGKVHFKDVLMGLSKEAVKTEFLLAKMAEYNIVGIIHRSKAPLFHKLARVSGNPTSTFTVGHHFAAEVVQMFYKEHVKGKKRPKGKSSDTKIIGDEVGADEGEGIEMGSPSGVPVQEIRAGGDEEVEEIAIE